MAIINGKKILQVVQTQGVAVNVEANPAGTATETLEKLLVDDTIYAVEGGASQVDDHLDPNSVLPVQNKVVTAALGEKANVDGYYETFGYARESGVASNLKNRDNAYVGAEYTRRTAGGTADIGSGTALIKKLKGNSVVFNQLVQNGNFESDTQWYIEAVYASRNFQNNKITVTDYDAQYSNNGIRQSNTNLILGHKYFISVYVDLLSFDNVGFILGQSYGSYIYKVISGNSSANISGIIVPNSQLIGGYHVINVGTLNTHTICSFSVSNFILIDLTQMFGAGNEPSTVAEFKALFPLDYYTYNAGEIINFNGTGIKTVGFNAYNNTTGTAALIGGNEYQISGTYTSVSYEDLNGNAETLTIDGNGLFTPTNTGTLTVVGGTATDTCVHLTWSGYRNGEFEEYDENTLTFDISSFKDTNDDTLFPNGLCSAGTAYDEITPNGATKGIGSYTFTGNETWEEYSVSRYRCTVIASLVKAPSSANNVANIKCAGFTAVNKGNVEGYSDGIAIDNDGSLFIHKPSDITSVATAQSYMAGKTINYELKTPVTITFDTPLNLGYKVDDFGTEELLPANTATPITSPINYDVLYAFNAIDTLRNLPKNYISKSSFDNFTAALIGAMATIGYTMTVTPTYDSANNEYDFNVTLAQTPTEP